MAKKQGTTNPKQATTARIKRTEAYAEKVRLLFAKTVNDILALNKTMPKLDDGVMFSFDGESMKKQKEVEALLRRLHSSVTMAIKQGIGLEWEQANIESDKLIQSVFGKKILESPMFTAWTQRNNAARDAFINRSEKGLNLSDRIWKSVRQLRDEMEVAMTVAIGEGESASAMSRQVRQYLNDPDLMFRRFRYKTGEDDQGNPIYGLKWKKRIKDEATGKYKWIDYDRDSYKTGAGVYKSSAKNAMRVARTETNIAYRRADHERWQQLDFVLGQRVQLSKNHPMKDICDKLQGDYPKDFVFDGWHPQCFCFVTPILIDEEEMAKVNEAFLKGEKYVPKGKMITEYPDNFKEWVTSNAENIADARDRGTEPYFIRNNAGVIDEILNQQPKEPIIEGKAALPNTNMAAPQFKYEDIDDPNISYISDESKLPLPERLENLLKGIEGAYGSSAVVNIVRSRNIADPIIAKQNWDMLKSWRDNDHIALYQSISHLNELRGADFSKVPVQWQATLNDLIKKINAHDMTKGCSGVYPEIEHAYNIFKLSTTQSALDYGLDKLSDKTPYPLFTVLQKKITGFPIPQKEFFDKLDRFVPLITEGSGSYYSPTFKHVCISVNKSNIERLSASKWYQSGLVFHEYGHALDYQKGIHSEKSLIKMFDDWKAAVAKDDGKALEAAIHAILDPEKQKFDDWWHNSSEQKAAMQARADAIKAGDLKAYNKAVKAYNDLYERLYREHLYELEEQLGAFSDCLGAALRGKRWVSPRNHKKNYFSIRENQLAEFIAHCSENYWNGNPYFKKLDPQLYNLMCEYIKNLK